MSLLEIVKTQLKDHEGLRLKPYHDTVGKLTIGYGRNLEDRGIRQKEAEFMLENDIMDSVNEAYGHIISFAELSEKRQAVIVDMIFNMGLGTFMTFHNFLACIDNKIWKEAARAMRASKWYTQVGGRAEELAQQMENG